MPTDKDTAEYFAQMLDGLGEIKTRKMFNEFCVYIDDKPVGFIIDNHPMVKTNEAMRKLRPEIEQRMLFEGAKNPMWYVDDADNRSLIRELYALANKHLPKPLPKASKSKRVKSGVQKRVYRDGEGSPHNDPAVMGLTKGKK